MGSKGKALMSLGIDEVSYMEITLVDPAQYKEVVLYPPRLPPERNPLEGLTFAPPGGRVLLVSKQPGAKRG